MRGLSPSRFRLAFSPPREASEHTVRFYEENREEEFNAKSAKMAERCFTVLLFLCISALLEGKTEKRDAPQMGRDQSESRSSLHIEEV